MKKSLILTIGLLTGVAAFAQNSHDKAVLDKAEFLLGLIDDVEWTRGEPPHDSETITIYVVGQSPVAGALEELAAGGTDRKHQFEVKTVTPDDDLKNCDILFLPDNDLAILARTLKKVGDSRIITVADAPDFARYGVMINLAVTDTAGKTQLEVNRLVLEGAGLKLSEKLMKKALII